jgi:ClpP class serine protease
VPGIGRDWFADAVRRHDNRGIRGTLKEAIAGADVFVGVSAAAPGLVRELVEERSLACAGEHGLRSLEVVVAAHLSHERGHAPIALPLSDFDLKAKWLPIT